MSLTARVVIPTHERRGRILALAADLLDQTVERSRLRIVIVCDGCRDGTAVALRSRFGDALLVLEQPPSGPAVARNRGAAGAAEDVLLFLDDDMRAGTDLVERHLEIHARRPGAIVLGAMPVHPDSPRSFLTEGLARWAARRDASLSAPGSRPDFDEVLSGNVSVGRETFERLGGFDPRFTSDGAFGDEDLEFGWRAVSSGVPVVYAPLAIAAQVFDKRFAAVASDVRRGAVADVRFASKHPEARNRLPLGRENDLPPWERRAVRLGRSRPVLGGMVAAPLVAALDALGRIGARGPRLEHAHAVVRALVYGLGVAEALSAQTATSGPKRR